MTTTVTLDILDAYLVCKFKAQLRLNGQKGEKSDYEAGLLESRADVKLKVVQKIRSHVPDNALTIGVVLSNSVLRNGVPFIIDADLHVDHLSVHFDGLKKVDGPSDLGRFHYLPVLFYEGHKIRRPQRVLLEVLALLLARVQGKQPSAGIIYHGSECTATTIRFSSGLKNAEELLEQLMELQSGGTPKLLLNDHCQVCEFHRQCHIQAIEEDNLSLLRGLGEKEVKTLARKGLFTLTQLAHTFRPRRKGKRADNRSNHRYHALQALAIRDKRIYVLGAPKVPASAVRIYADFEGNPDEGVVYLIGLIVCDNFEEKRYSFWADNKDEELGIFEQFLGVICQYDKPLVFCYGSYERAFIKRMRQQARRKKPVDAVLETLVNTLSTVYAHFYFPTYSNGLKAVAGCLGFSWSDEEASGVQSISWRMRWERTRDDAWKQKLLEYNMEDCVALRIVTEFLRDAVAEPGTTPTPSSPIISAPYSTPHPQVMRVQELDQLASDRKWGPVNFVHSNFEFVNNRAYFDYQRQRVFVRTSRIIRKHRRRTGLQKNRKIRPSRQVLITASRCPICGGKDLAEITKWGCHHISRRRCKRAMDLVITRGGMKRRVIECRAITYRCVGCGHVFVPDRYIRLAKHYHGLMSWATYEHVVHQVGSRTLADKFTEFFDLQIANSEIHMFKSLMARYYQRTFRGLLNKILAGPVLHVDETAVKLRTGKAYVWVFASLEEVVFIYRPTREGEFLKPMLKDFRGVLVSDFYTAYDSIECEQQRCLVHLIRDMNQELLNNPFDEELRLVTLPFSDLLKAIISTVDEHGLKRRHLIRHQRDVDTFFRTLAAQSFSSEAAVALRARLEKNRDKLFTFIQHDGVPWNNNNAENAIKRFAYYREDTAGTMKPTGLSEYLVLLSLYQPCRYKGVSFFKFLLSKQRDVDVFSAKKWPQRHPEIELYPTGFVHPTFKFWSAERKSKRLSTKLGIDQGSRS